MYDDYNDVRDHANSLPSLLVRIGIAPRGSKRIIEHELGCLETQLVLSPVGAALALVPYPAQGRQSLVVSLM